MIMKRIQFPPVLSMSEFFAWFGSEAQCEQALATPTPAWHANNRESICYRERNGGLLFVPSCGVLEILFGLTTKPNKKSHKRALMSASTSSAARPVLPSAS